MSQDESRDNIKSIIEEKIQFIKLQATGVRTSLKKLSSQDEENLNVVKKALSQIEIFKMSLLDDLTKRFEDLTSFKDAIVDLSDIISVFLGKYTIELYQSKLLQASTTFLKELEKINQISVDKNDSKINLFGGDVEVQADAKTYPFRDKQNPSTIKEEFQELSQRVSKLESKPDKFFKKIKLLEQIAQESQQKIASIEASAIEFASNIEDKKRNAKTTQAEMTQVFENLKRQGEETLNHNISLVLSEQFQEKAIKLKNEADDKLGEFFWSSKNESSENQNNTWIKKIVHPKGFRGAISLLFFVNMVVWLIWLLAVFAGEQYIRLDFWHFMMIKLTINIPLIFYTVFSLNEYAKAKKLYEEFDYKRILAITLVNNYKRLRGEEFGLDDKQAFELIKSPFEKIFENPVHSIYGDKSGDKGFQIDQFEKMASIIEKVKK